MYPTKTSKLVNDKKSEQYAKEVEKDLQQLFAKFGDVITLNKVEVSTVSANSLVSSTITATSLDCVTVSCSNIVIGKTAVISGISSTSTSITGFAIAASSTTTVAIGLTGCKTTSAIFTTPYSSPADKWLTWCAYVTTANIVNLILLNSSAGVLTFSTTNWRVDAIN